MTQILMMIYSFVLRYPVPIHFFMESTFYSQFHGPPHLSLLGVSKLVRKDALIAFARVNTLTLNTINGVPDQWMGRSFLRRLSSVEFVLPMRRGCFFHEEDILELLKRVRACVPSVARMRFVVESRDCSVARRSNPVLKSLANMQRIGKVGRRRPVVSFEEHLELGWTDYQIEELSDGENFELGGTNMKTEESPSEKSLEVEGTNCMMEEELLMGDDVSFYWAA
ncbi:hypothetical protein FGG08_001635 [Glutinoglossum americanum]|uniref:Uncharacterized protein n=1 Tax=Glutinoglossum americanum TaxID=1670608 RepID=A0A9P8L562_9PEZI|nr:hypothetical protein FGG08_001635 [Glutinoglossum americanum]